MPNPDDDATLGAPEPTDPAPTATPESRISLNVSDVEPTEDRMLTLDELLAEARLPEDYARICLRADLEAELTLIDTELAALVDADGHLIDDEERDLAEAGSAAARAQDLADRRRATAAEMAKSIRFVRFRGLSSAASAAFDEKHAVKDPANARKVAEFNDKLVAATAVSPTITVEQMAQYRERLGPRSIAQLTATAKRVCTRGGVDVPKSPVSSLSLGFR